jgi:hypothetical protein
MTPATDVVPLAVVPRELIERAYRLACRQQIKPLGISDAEWGQLIADLEAALAASGGREGQDHG